MQENLLISLMFNCHSETVSPIYYYSYKRSALKMSDPRFYENMDWVSEFLAIK